MERKNLLRRGWQWIQTLVSYGYPTRGGEPRTRVVTRRSFVAKAEEHLRRSRQTPGTSPVAPQKQAPLPFGSVLPKAKPPHPECRYIAMPGDPDYQGGD
ncbi:MAG: hypothetical protein RL150_318 [Candidatus Parcubacteria bacterium]|jgi:hypothetical protein